MVKEIKKDSCCDIGAGTCCKVEALVSVDERGQMVLPKDLREKAGILPGDKLAVTSWAKDDKVCCIILTRAEDLTSMVRATLGPIMQEISKK